MKAPAAATIAKLESSLPTFWIRARPSLLYGDPGTARRRTGCPNRGFRLFGRKSEVKGCERGEDGSFRTENGPAKGGLLKGWGAGRGEFGFGPAPFGANRENGGSRLLGAK